MSEFNFIYLMFGFTILLFFQRWFYKEPTAKNYVTAGLIYWSIQLFVELLKGFSK